MDSPKVSYPSDTEVCKYLNALWKVDVEHNSEIESYRVARQINKTLDFWEKQGYYGWKLDISIEPSDQRGHTLEVHNYQGRDEPVSIEMSLKNATMWHHTIDMEVEDVRFRMAEHILWVFEHLNVFGSRIVIDAQKWGMSWPMEETCVSQYAHAIQDNSETFVDETAEIKTVKFPTLVEFWWARESSVLLRPDTWSKTMRTQIHIDYPHIPSIGKKSIWYEVGDYETFLNYIAGSRSNSFGLYNIALRAPTWMKNAAQRVFSDKPFGVSSGQVTEVDTRGILNPCSPYQKHELWAVSELLYHSILDKSAVRPLTWFKRVGTDVIDKLSHEQDLCVTEMLVSWAIPIVEVSTEFNLAPCWVLNSSVSQ